MITFSKYGGNRHQLPITFDRLLWPSLHLMMSYGRLAQSLPGPCPVTSKLPSRAETCRPNQRRRQRPLQNLVQMAQCRWSVTSMVAVFGSWVMCSLDAPVKPFLLNFIWNANQILIPTCLVHRVMSTQFLKHRCDSWTEHDVHWNMLQHREIQWGSLQEKPLIVDIYIIYIYIYIISYMLGC